MKKSIQISIISCCLIVFSAIGVTTSASEQAKSKVIYLEPTISKTQLFFSAKLTALDNNIEGKVRFYGFADSAFASIYLVTELAPETIEWMIEHYDRTQVYAPFFDEHTYPVDGYHNGLEYKDLYAIYDCAQAVNDIACHPDNPNTEHREMYDAAMLAEADPDLPDWVMKDSEGNRLYLLHGCSSEAGQCPQLAADIRNPAFRELWIKQMTSALEGGDYRGLFIDDVNLDVNRSLSNGSCTIAGTNNKCDWTVNITANEWADSVANFVEEIRLAFPSEEKEIVHNSVWFHTNSCDSYPKKQLCVPYLEPYLERQIDAADTIVFERGVNDAGITIANIEDFFYAHDTVHSRGRNMIHAVQRNELVCSSDPCIAPLLTKQIKLIQYEYGLAGWLLVSQGQDLFGTKAPHEFNTPDNWWHGFGINLGHAFGKRYHYPDSSLYRRDFEHGIVLLNAAPHNNDNLKFDAEPVTVMLPHTFYTLDGDAVNEMTLPMRTGKVLFREPPKPNFTGPGGFQSN